MKLVLFQVTLSAFANILDISIQDSSTILKQYVKDNEKLKPDLLSTTYILSGILNKNHKQAVYLIKGSEIDSKRTEFQQISSEILHSVQKSKNIDFNIVALADWPNLTSRESKLTPL